MKPSPDSTPPSHPPSASGAWRAGLAAAGLGLVLRLAWLFYARPVPVSDFADYKALAAGLLDHGRLGFPAPVPDRLPGYPLFLAAAMLVSRSDLWLGLVNVLLSALLVLVVHRLSLRLTGGAARVATPAALLCALYPRFVFYSPLLASENLHAVLLFGGLLLLVESGDRGRSRALVAGAVLGWASLVRGDGLFYLPVYLMVPLYQGGLRRLARVAVFLLLPFGLFVGGWYVRNLVQIGPGAGLSTLAGLNFYLAHNDQEYGYTRHNMARFRGMSPVAVQELGYRLGWESIRANPLRVFSDAARGTLALYAPRATGVGWSGALPRPSPEAGDVQKPLPGRRVLGWIEDTGTVALAALALASLLTLAAFPAPAWAVPLAVIFMNWMCYAVIFLAIDRYRFCAEVAFCLLGALALARLRSARARPRPRA
jgi:hypothetical protein